MSNKTNHKAPDNMPDYLSPAPPVTDVPLTITWDNLVMSRTACPVLTLPDQVLFPNLPLPVHITSERSIRLVKEALERREMIAVVAQKNPEIEEPEGKDIYRTGVISQVMKVVDNNDDAPVVVFLAPAYRIRVQRITSKTPYLKAKVEPWPLEKTEGVDMEYDALLEAVSDVYHGIVSYLPDNESTDLLNTLKQLEGNPELHMSFEALNSPLDVPEKIEMLEAPTLKERARIFLKYLDSSLQKLELKANIAMRTREELSRQQKEQFLQMQIRNIRDELGDGMSEETDADELEKRASEMQWSEETAAHFRKELQKLGRFNIGNPEYGLQYTYLDTMLSLPWGKYSNSDFTIDDVEKTLERDHYGLEKVKERIVEHMAVLKLRNDMKAPILCLYGPPGVGKTSLGRSIADATGRKYARVSLGGLRDEAEIRGHRRTYLGSMPGRIIAALQKCGEGDPVFVLDEIDKVGADYKGDPAAALLEVLDPEQNSRFHDNYLDCDYDLSKIMFIATANNISGISQPLLDRMELIEISGYVTEEKIEIASRHLVGRALTDHGFSEGEITFTPEALRYIIERYTRESGVRQLEKRIAKALRRVARLKASGKSYPEVITPELVREYLGNEEVTPDMYENNDTIGVVTGLAWTSAGGEILFIESSISAGKGEKLTLTGNLGDVMKESAVIALQYLKAHAPQLGIDSSAFSVNDVHVHVPEGAIPKDGPSAGITIATSLASSFTGRKVRGRLAMTGEITLRGKVLPVGGIKEKILAAKRAGITDVMLSTLNRKDIEEIEPRYLEGLTFHYVDKIEEVLNYALLPKE